MHAVIEMDHVELVGTEHHFDFLEQSGIGNERRGGQPADISFAGQTFFNSGIVIPGDGITNQEHAGQIGFIGVGNPDVAPLNGFP